MSKSKRKYPRSSPPYPANWGKVAYVLRRVVGCCEMCGAEEDLTVHHVGAPLATGDGWRPGDARDKRDCRRENLFVLCTNCHDRVDSCRPYLRELKERRRAKRERHRALGIGVGLVPYEGEVA